MNRVSPIQSTGSKNLDASEHSAETEDYSYEVGDSSNETFYSCASQASSQPSLTSSKIDEMTFSPIDDISRASSELSVIDGEL